MNFPATPIKCIAAALTVALGVGACASNPAPDQKIAVARESLTRAEQSGAPQAAPTELASARDKLAQAEKAKTDHKEPLAAAMADQAAVDAQVAEATALQQRSHKAATEFDASMQTLQQESQRNSDPQNQPQPQPQAQP
jgi:hypothetical protein